MEEADMNWSLDLPESVYMNLVRAAEANRIVSTRRLALTPLFAAGGLFQQLP